MKPKKRLVVKKNPTKLYDKVYMPGSGSISYTNYTLNAKRNPYLAFKIVHSSRQPPLTKSMNNLSGGKKKNELKKLVQ